MSSVYVRTQIKQFLDDNSAEEVVDLTAQYQEIKELITDVGLQPDTPWLGLEFIGDEMVPISLAATNDTGLYRETGALHFHVVEPARLGIGDVIASRAEALQNLFMGQRIGDIVVVDVTPVNTASGSTLQFEGGYVGGSFYVHFYRDLNLSA